VTDIPDPYTTQRAALKQIWGNLNQALLVLTSAQSATSDVDTLTSIHYAYSAINSISHLVIQAFMQTDNNLFVQENTYLVSQTTLLQDAVARLDKIVAVVADVGKAIGFVAQAIKIVDAL